jgi:hypothetical protein
MDYHQVATTGGEKRLQGDVVKMSFVDANVSRTTGQKPLPGSINYFTGKDLAHCATKVPHFAEAVSGNVYKGVDTRYYLDKGTPRYDLIVNPGADPSKVALKFEGAEDVRVLPNGNLAIKTSIGQMEQSGLQAYQQIGSTRVPISCQMTASGGVVRFNVSSYDHANALIIDPIIKPQATPQIKMSQLIFGGYENGPDYIPREGGLNSLFVDMCLDSQDNMAYIGYGSDAAFPTSTGAYQRSFSSYLGITGYLAKVNSSGDGLIYATYLGGTDPSMSRAYTQCNTIRCDANGNAFVAGTTNFLPTTPGAFQRTNLEPNDLQSDGSYVKTSTGFIAKVSADGSTLLACTYLGGTGANRAIKSFRTGEDVSSLDFDHNGDLVIGGDTTSVDFPTTSGVIQSQNKAYAHGYGTAFIGKMDTNLQKLKSCTFLGGSSDSGATSIQVDSDNNILISSFTYSTDVPVTLNAYQKTNISTANVVGQAGGSGVIARISNDCKSLLYSTYMGTTNGGGAGVQAMKDGRLLLVGQMTVPLTPGTYSTGFNNGYGTYLAIFSHDGSKCLRATYLDSMFINACVFDLKGNFVFSSLVDEAVPTTPDALYQTQQLPNKWEHTGFSGIMNPDMTGLLYGTRFGAEPAPPDGSGIGTIRVDSVGTLVFSASGRSLPVIDSVLAPPVQIYYLGAILVADFAAMDVKPQTVVAGSTTVGRIMLNFPAMQPGVKLDLQCDNPAVAVPPSIDFLVGQVQTTFTIYTSDLATSPIAHITASYGGAEVCQTALALTFPALAFEVSTQESVSKSTVTGEVKIAKPAVAPGVVVSLSSDNPLVTIPKTVPIYAGSTSAFFPVTSNSVTTPLDATLTARIGSLSKSVTLTVNPMVNSFSVAPASVVGGAAALGTVSLAGKSGVSGLNVGLSSSNPNVTVPSTVTIPPQQSYASFQLATKGVNASTAVVITAKLANMTKTSTMTLMPATLLSVTPSVVAIGGGNPVNAILKLNGKTGTLPVSVSMTSSNAAVTIPTTVSIASGTSSQVFRITTKSVTAVTKVTVSAKLGAVTQTTVLTLNPPGA